MDLARPLQALLNEAGEWHPDAIERQLGHVEANEVRAAYARGEHWDERVAMMQWWADNLDHLKRNNVVQDDIEATTTWTKQSAPRQLHSASNTPAATGRTRDMYQRQLAQIAARPH